MISQDPSAEEDVAPAGAASLRILVVEDHADTLKYLLLFLEQLGHQASSARSMQEAKEVLQVQAVDVLITDIGLTDGKGWDLVRHARVAPEVFCISMSGFGLDSEIAKSAELGFRRHLRKPFLPRELEELLRSAAAEILHRG